MSSTALRAWLLAVGAAVVPVEVVGAAVAAVLAAAVGATVAVVIVATVGAFAAPAMVGAVVVPPPATLGAGVPKGIVGNNGSLPTGHALSKKVGKSVSVGVEFH